MNYEVKEIKIDCLPGSVIDDTIERADDMSKKNNNCVIMFKFNGVPMSVKHGDDLATLNRMYLYLLGERDWSD